MFDFCSASNACILGNKWMNRHTIDLAVCCALCWCVASAAPVTSFSPGSFLRSIHTKDCVKRKCTVFILTSYDHIYLCVSDGISYNGYLRMTNKRLISVQQCAVSAGVRMQNFRSALTWQPPRLSEYHHLHFHLILNFPFWMADAVGAAGAAKWVSISIKLADIFWHFTTAVYTEKKS